MRNDIYSKNIYNLFKEKGLLKNENLICKEVAIPETFHEVESYSDYDSDLSENSVTTSNESEMTDLAGLFAESEIEVPEVVRAENYHYIKNFISSRSRNYQIKILFTNHLAVTFYIVLDTQTFYQCTSGNYAHTSCYVPLFAMGRAVFQTIDLEILA
jgi:hypothetical protein